MSKNPVIADFKVKITSDDSDQVANALDQIASLYENPSFSSVMRSQPKGWHGFITVHRKAQR